VGTRFVVESGLLYSRQSFCGRIVRRLMAEGVYPKYVFPLEPNGRAWMYVIIHVLGYYLLSPA